MKGMLENQAWLMSFSVILQIYTPHNLQGDRARLFTPSFLYGDIL